jgi:hypothetical protein
VCAGGWKKGRIHPCLQEVAKVARPVLNKSHTIYRATSLFNVLRAMGLKIIYFETVHTVWTINKGEQINRFMGKNKIFVILPCKFYNKERKFKPMVKG